MKSYRQVQKNKSVKGAENRERDHFLNKGSQSSETIKLNETNTQR